jgi:hypothetical protein
MLYSQLKELIVHENKFYRKEKEFYTESLRHFIIEQLIPLRRCVKYI